MTCGAIPLVALVAAAHAADAWRSGGATILATGIRQSALAAASPGTDGPPDSGIALANREMKGNMTAMTIMLISTS
jgi:hypothetical protein